MNREDIIRMAREAGFNVEQGYLLRITGIDEDLERFAALVASAERERIKQANAPEIERVNAHIKELEDAVKEALAQSEQETPKGWKSEIWKSVKQQEQESVTWGVDWGKAGDIPCVSIIKRVPNGSIEVMAVEYAPYSYTTPPQRTWVGLDSEEIRKAKHHMVEGAYQYSFKQGAEWAEAKLKEKNCG